MSNHSDLPVFDAQQSREARDEGISRASSLFDRHYWLLDVQRVAMMLARVSADGITADDVVKHYAMRDINISQILGNAMGSIFKPSSVWEWTGEIRNSERVGRHASALRVWKLRE